jgi:hypothetical protein
MRAMIVALPIFVALQKPNASALHQGLFSRQ